MSSIGPEGNGADEMTAAILHLTATMLEVTATQPPVSSPEYVLDRMIGPRTLDRNTARTIWDDIRHDVPFMNASAMDAVCETFATTESIRPYTAVRGIAGASPVAAVLMGSSTGVAEDYRLHEHTQAVLGRFDAQSAGQFSTEECKLIRMTLSLMDAAKPLANALDGTTDYQGIYNSVTIRAALRDMQSLTADEKTLINLCGSHDFIGMMLRGKISIDEARAGLDGIRRACPPQFRDRVDAYMKAIYFADATAYTSDAHYETPDGDTHACFPMLNYLFRTNEQGQPQFAEPFQQRLFGMLWHP